ncbi:DNA repair exonuclease [Bremerella cremea]|uniref:DNA repair exonuclease n=1 Tax=Bremerella cremea TaxID=1031537 RepID=A0A368KWV1_9BACT|nr:DNA repair exonuclease [Bremerella cremea]RCS54821.1 DNA repair exonuclease [Bremerella cremea]
MTKFLHTADLHIDSPLRGLALRDETMMRTVQRATRTALERIIDLALKEKVAFVLIAGDLFDGEWKDMHSGQWAAGQFRRLDEAGIGVYYIRGNHDAVSQIQRKIRWPDNVVELSHDKPDTIILEDYGVAIHGQGFADQKVELDLAARYPARVPGMFNIGMLHTSLTGSEQHDTYAPTSLEVLKSKAYDYWGLGHIHLRNAEPLCVEPYVTYSGNPQGRHIREAGDKGCLIGEIEGETLKGVTFHPTDTLRWQELIVDVSEDKSLDAVLAKAGQAIQAQHARHAGLSSAFRLTFQGASKVHEELSDLIRRAEIHQQIFAAAESVDDEVWIEKIRFETRPASEATARDAHELWQAIAQQFEQVQVSSEATQQMQDLVKPVLDKVTAAHINLSEEGTLEQRMPQWMEAAKQLLRSRLGAQES